MCVETFVMGGVIIFQIQDSSYDVIFSTCICLLKVMCDPSYRTIDGFINLLSAEWSTKRAKNTWIHFFILLTFVFEFIYRYPDQFEYTTDFIVEILNNPSVSVEHLQGLRLLKKYKYKTNNIPVGPLKWKWSKESPILFWSKYYLGFNNYLSRNHITLFSKSMEVKSANFLPSKLPLAYFPKINPNIETLDLKDCCLHSLFGLEQFKGIVKLELKKNLLKHVPKYIIEQLPNLQSLRMNQNGIRICASLNNPKLTELSLEDNDLISYEELCDMYTLKNLSLRGNEITKMPIRFAGLSQLENLGLSDNKIRQLPAKILKNQKSLISFDLSFNSILLLPDAFENLTKLTQLILTNNKISTLPNSISRCLNLTYLDLTSNNFKEVPKAIMPLTSLKHIKMSRNKITTLPIWLFSDRTQLNNLEFSENQIKAIPTSVCLLSKMNSILLDTNHIKVLPASLGALAPTTTFKIMSNPVSVTDCSIESLNAKLTSKVKVHRSRIYVVGARGSGKSKLVENISKDWTEAPEAPETYPESKISLHYFTCRIVKSKKLDKAPSKKEGKNLTRTIEIWEIPMEGEAHRLYIQPKQILIIVFSLVDEHMSDRLNYWQHFILSFPNRTLPEIYLVGTFIDKLIPDMVENKKREITNLLGKLDKANVQWKLYYVSSVGEEQKLILRNDIGITIQKSKALEMPASYLEFDKILKENSIDSPLFTTKKALVYGKALGMGTVETAKCLRDLNTAGYLYYVEQSQVTLLIANPLWLEYIYNKFTKCITTEREKKSKIQQKLPPDLPVDDLFFITEKQRILYPLPSENKTDETYLIPHKLNPERPDILLDLQNQKNEDLNLHSIQRSYVFSFYSREFFYKILAKICGQVTSVTDMWRDGIICGKNQARITLEFRKNITGIKLEKNHDELFLEVAHEKLEVVNRELCEIIFSIDEILDLTPEFITGKYSQYRVGHDVKNPWRDINEIQDEIQNHKSVPTILSVPDLIISEWKGERYLYNELKIETANQVGEGGFANVYFSEIEGVKMAVKVLKQNTQLKTAQASSVALKDLRTEISIQGQLNSPYIVRICGICILPICIVMEWCEYGCLYDYLHDYENYIPFSLRLKFASDIAKAIQYLQQLTPYPLVHLDMKSPNILLYSLNPNDPVRCKIADFGTSTFVSRPLKDRKVDNPSWLAPEILEGKLYNEKVDNYGFGVICWELLTRKDFLSDDQPFMSVTEAKIVRGDRPEIPAYTLEEYKKIVEQSWSQSPENRLSDWDYCVSTFEKLYTDVQFTEAIFFSNRAPPHHKKSKKEEKRPRSGTFKNISKNGVVKEYEKSRKASEAKESGGYSPKVSERRKDRSRITNRTPSTHEAKVEARSSRDRASSKSGDASRFVSPHRLSASSQKRPLQIPNAREEFDFDSAESEISEAFHIRGRNRLASEEEMRIEDAIIKRKTSKSRNSTKILMSESHSDNSENSKDKAVRISSDEEVHLDFARNEAGEIVVFKGENEEDYIIVNTMKVKYRMYSFVTGLQAYDDGLKIKATTKDPADSDTSKEDFSESKSKKSSVVLKNSRKNSRKNPEKKEISLGKDEPRFTTILPNGMERYLLSPALVYDVLDLLTRSHSKSHVSEKHKRRMRDILSSQLSFCSLRTDNLIMKLRSGIQSDKVSAVSLWISPANASDPNVPKLKRSVFSRSAMNKEFFTDYWELLDFAPLENRASMSQVDSPGGQKNQMFTVSSPTKINVPPLSSFPSSLLTASFSPKSPTSPPRIDKTSSELNQAAFDLLNSSPPQVSFMMPSIRHSATNPISLLNANTLLTSSNGSEYNPSVSEEPASQSLASSKDKEFDLDEVVVPIFGEAEKGRLEIYCFTSESRRVQQLSQWGFDILKKNTSLNVTALVRPISQE
eukprot:TRINITY_DN14986_c0_g1_i3.p1 TRINITY_DN14986_c0_g1~~TRINITY_DN14986_c0_g1_i3.p1  ORF type:complete len:2207 (-),score=444.99 TRINITY_DN14986_c0_g1_i3:313-5973(-)